MSQQRLPQFVLFFCQSISLEAQLNSIRIKWQKKRRVWDTQIIRVVSDSESLELQSDVPSDVPSDVSSLAWGTSTVSLLGGSTMIGAVTVSSFVMTASTWAPSGCCGSGWVSGWGYCGSGATIATVSIFSSSSWWAFLRPRRFPPAFSLEKLQKPPR